MRIVLLLVVLGCGAAHPPAEEPGSQSGGSEPPVEPVAESAAEPAEPQRHPGLAPLRPSGAERVLARLEQDPTAASHVVAMEFYVDTDAAGMVLLWGFTHAALDFDGEERLRVARMMRRVLEERVVVRDGGRRVTTRFAPGQLPVFVQEDGVSRAPVTHLFELLSASAFAVQGARTWGEREIQSAMDLYTQQVIRGTPIDSVVAVHEWLGHLTISGHLRGFVAHAFDVGTPRDRRLVDGAREWISANPLTIDRATMPDDLVPFTP